MSSKILCLALILGLSVACHSTKHQEDNWCEQTIRPQFLELEEIVTQNPWYKVHKVGENVFSIAEPYNFQEIISYLILGENKALLFDTGMGMSSIYELVRELTNLPITVLNSHTHYDHIGGNHEFDNILAMQTNYTLKRAKNGMPHQEVKYEITSEALCTEHLPEFDKEAYHIKPFTITDHIQDGSIIDLGNRSLQVISVPGHTPDAIALFDEKSGYLWTGDTFYEAPIWLFAPETNLEQYKQSIRKLADLTGGLTRLFPAHNTPIADPERLTELVEAFDKIMSGDKEPDRNINGEHVEDASVQYDFEHFSFIIRKDRLQEAEVLK